jgi:hypothetical protein
MWVEAAADDNLFQLDNDSKCGAVCALIVNSLRLMNSQLSAKKSECLADNSLWLRTRNNYYSSFSLDSDVSNGQMRNFWKIIRKELWVMFTV